MSSSLRWRPVAEDESLGYDLKWAIAPQLWGHDGSLQGDWTVVGRGFVPFLRGVSAGRREDDDVRRDAERLIALIEKYGEVEVSLVN